jgi:hypothetical protein
MFIQRISSFSIVTAFCAASLMLATQAMGGFPQLRGDACERRFLLTPGLTSIFAAPNFSTFATESASCGHATASAGGRRGPKVAARSSA